MLVPTYERKEVAMRILNIVTSPRRERSASLLSSILFFSRTKRRSKELWSTHWTFGPSRFRNSMEHEGKKRAMELARQF